MRLYFPVDLTGNLVMIEKLVLGKIWTRDLPIFNPEALTSAPPRQANDDELMMKQGGAAAINQSIPCPSSTLSRP